MKQNTKDFDDVRIIHKLNGILSCTPTARPFVKIKKPLHGYTCVLNAFADERNIVDLRLQKWCFNKPILISYF